MTIFEVFHANRVRMTIFSALGDGKLFQKLEWNVIFLLILVQK